MFTSRELTILIYALRYYAFADETKSLQEEAEDLRNKIVKQIAIKESLMN